LRSRCSACRASTTTRRASASCRRPCIAAFTSRACSG
jgi:hypothetical protein